MKSISDSDEPNLDSPQIDMVAARRANERSDRDEPKWRKSKTDTADPIRKKLRNDIAAPK
jgi:hypothetical protein